MGKVPTEMELVLEQTQQGSSHEVLAETGSIHMLLATPILLSGIEDSHHGPSDAIHNPPQPLKVDPHELEDTYKDGVELKNIKKDVYTRFQHQEQYEHVSSEVTSAQKGKRSQDDDKRLCLDDDLKKLKDHIHVKSKIQVKA
ncbi:hypothetical protein Tco_1342761 [Tanacetum coccineum]